MYLFLRELCLNLIQLLSQIRVCQSACGNGQRLLFYLQILGQCLQRFRHLRIQKSQHTHAVFQLREAIVTLRLRQFPLCQNVKFIAGVNEMNAVLLVDDLLPLFNDVDGTLRIFLLKGL